MQYIAALFGLASPVQTMPNVLFFDEKDGVTKTQMRDLATAKANAHKARAFLGIGSQLNPVAGQYGNKYLPTFAKYAANKDWDPATYEPITQENTVGFSPHVSDAVSTDYQSYNATKAQYSPSYTINRGTIVVNCPFDVKLYFPKCAAASTDILGDQFGRLPSTIHYRSFNGSVVNRSATDSNQFVTGYNNPSIAPTDVYTVATVNFRYAMAMKELSVATDRGNFADMYLPYRNNGLFWGPREATDETVNLTFGLFYWKAFNTLVMLDQNDYDVAPNLVPGTRPAFRFKTTNLRI